MWYLHGFNDSIIYLWEKDVYTVGRKNKDIIIENDDSISRNHGVIKIKDNNLYLFDLGSKYGTYIGEVKLAPNKENKLSMEDIITFGLLQHNQSKFKVKKVNFEVVLSNVKSNEKHEQYTALDNLKVTRSSNWSPSCTHIIVNELLLTSKILCALTTGQHIVNVQFFPDYLKAVKTNTKPPLESDYIPVFNETLLNKNIKLEYHPDRKTLFKDMIFIFLTEKCKKNLEEVVTTTGGKTISWQKQELGTDTLKLNSHRYLFIEDSTETINKESKIYQSFQKAIKFLKTVGRRSIPMQEIALAIVHNSREENCNTLFNRASLLVPEKTQDPLSEQIFAYDTQHSSNSRKDSEEQSQELPSIVVEPSFETQGSPSVKRSLEIDLTVSDEPANKKSKEDQPSTSTQFSFRKPSSQSTPSVSQPRLDKFSFNKTKETENKSKTNDVIEVEMNPFSRKRKASNNLNFEAKKRPLENISNLEATKAVKEKPKEVEKYNETINNSMVQVKDYSVSIIKFQALLSLSWIKKESSIDENQIKNEPEDEEITKLNEMFKDSVIIEFCSIVSPRNKNVSTQNNSISTKNFKKFKKIHQNIQSEIICDLNKVVAGDESICPPDEEEDDDEMDDLNTFSSRNTSKNRPQQRRKFQF